MIRSSRLVLVSAACAFCFNVGPVLADGEDVAPEPVFFAPSMLWNSVYVGVHGGWADANVDWTYQNINPYSAPGPGGPITLPGDGFSPDGFIGGGQIGVQHQFGLWVLGAEVSYSSLDLDETHVSPGQFVGAGNAQFVTTNISDLLTITAKLGYTFDPRWLVYVKGGYASAKVETGGFVEGVPGFDFSTSEREDGWTLGGGAEYKMTDTWSLAVDYAHVELGSSSRIGDLAITPPVFDVLHDVDTEIDAVTVRLNWHWNRSQPVVALK